MLGEFGREAPYALRKRMLVRKGVNMCIMVCGRPGTGKSTFINTLCDGTVFGRPTSDQKVAMLSGDCESLTVRINTVELTEENGGIINLTIVDFPHFGCGINNRASPRTVLNYVEEQYDKLLAEERRVSRTTTAEDSRVHACLYFLSGSPRGLHSLDLEMLRLLAPRVNVVPLITKADTMTPTELGAAKKALADEIRERGIPVYQFTCQSDDEAAAAEMQVLRRVLPFAVVGSNEVYQVGSAHYARGRLYEWGFTSVEDPGISDFGVLQSVLFGTHLHELLESTQAIYERYRTEKLMRSDRDSSLFADSLAGPSRSASFGTLRK